MQFITVTIKAFIFDKQKIFMIKGIELKFPLCKLALRPNLPERDVQKLGEGYFLNLDISFAFNLRSKTLGPY